MYRRVNETFYETVKIDASISHEYIDCQRIMFCKPLS